MIRTSLLGGNTINLDKDYSKYIESVSTPGIISGLKVESGKVKSGLAWVGVTRSNSEFFYCLVENTEDLTLTTTGTKKVWIEVKQEAIDNGLLNPENGTGISEIKTGSSRPTKNFLKLASISGGTITDERVMIPKVQELQTQTNQLSETVATHTGQIATLQEAGAIDHLEESGILGERVEKFDLTYIMEEKIVSESIKYIKKEPIPNIPSGSSYGRFIFYDQNNVEIPHTEIINPGYGFYPNSECDAASEFIKEFKSNKKISRVVYNRTRNNDYNTIPQYWVSVDGTNWIKLNARTNSSISVPYNVFATKDATKNYTPEEQSQRLNEVKMFKQLTPKLADCALPVNIGDIARNKEIHIQRIGSGTASNQLKLKLKKSGSPTTNLIVEVRKGVKVDVNNKEAYRYGEQVVASGSIPYSQLTTDWQEKTITLNTSFGGTKGELLDVVVYQTDRIVNGTNYYQIACDSTQYSEAFSYVSVDGTSRVREKLMPYCVSGGLSDCVMVKSSKNKILEETKNTNYNSRVNGNSYGAIITIFTTAVIKKTKLTISGTIQSSTASASHKITLKINGIIKKEYGIGSNSTYSINDVFSDFPIGSIVTFEFSFGDAYGSSYAYTPNLNFKEESFIDKLGQELNVKSASNIGDLIELISFGKLPNGERKGEIDTTISTTATTGTITLGNAQGFVSILGQDGKKYKIPVYAE